MRVYPKISVVTPSYNQGHFLEQTILSVIGQNYPNIEYIIIDGGSTDNSINIIKKYSNKISFWISEPDLGQADAINKGFAKSTGEILCWLNSDDLFMPNIFEFISQQINIDEKMIITGDCIHFEEKGSFGTYAVGSQSELNISRINIFDADPIIQPSTFWTRKVWNSVGVLDINLHYVFDWDWFIKATINKVEFKVVNKTLSLYRIHKDHKTLNGNMDRHKEIINVYLNFKNEQNANTYKFLLRDKIILKRKILIVFRRLLVFFRIKLNDAQILKIIFPSHYKNVVLAKLQNLIYFTN